MKTKNLIITGLLACVPLWSFAQEWDDIYADPTAREVVKVTQKPIQQKRRVVVVEGTADNMQVIANGRDVDAGPKIRA